MLIFLKIIVENVRSLAKFSMEFVGSKVHRFSFRRAMILEVAGQKWPEGHRLKSPTQVQLKKIPKFITTNTGQDIKF